MNVIFSAQNNIFIYSFSLILFLIYIPFNKISLKIYNKNLNMLGGAGTFKFNEKTTLIDFLFHIFILGLIIIFAIIFL